MVILHFHPTFHFLQSHGPVVLLLFPALAPLQAKSCILWNACWLPFGFGQGKEPAGNWRTKAARDGDIAPCSFLMCTSFLAPLWASVIAALDGWPTMILLSPCHWVPVVLFPPLVSLGLEVVMASHSCWSLGFHPALLFQGIPPPPSVRTLFLTLSSLNSASHLLYHLSQLLALLIPSWVSVLTGLKNNQNHLLVNKAKFIID